MEPANQTSRVVYQLSQLIIRGEFVPGERLAEIPLAERFGVSRTPIRHAFSVLEKEGLLIRGDSGRSYTVRRFKLEEILDAIEVRSVLEGLAAREVAQARKPRGLLRELEALIDEASELIETIEIQGATASLTEKYFSINTRFHRAIIEGSNNYALGAALEQVSKIPFVSVGSIARYNDNSDDDSHTARLKVRHLLLSHMQHQNLLEAIVDGQAARAEALMREHGQLGVRNLHLRDRIPIELAGTHPVPFHEELSKEEQNP
jgi:GntR family transcriptional regulator of vanillate catabolism